NPPLPLRERGRGRGVLFQRPTNHLQHHVHIPQNIMVPESQYPESLIRQPAIPLRITHTVLMLTAIDFYNQSCVEVNKVDYISSQWLLPAKLLPVNTVRTQPKPQCIFSICHVAAQMFCEIQ